MNIGLDLICIVKNGRIENNIINYISDDINSSCISTLSLNNFEIELIQTKYGNNEI